MCAFDLPTPEARAEALRRALTERIIVLGCGKRSIRLRPALTLPEREADEGVERLGRAIAGIPA